MTSRRTHSAGSDPFRLLAIIGIVIGLLIVVLSAVFWLLTGRQSALVMGAGMTLAIGGGLRNLAASYMSQFPVYAPPRPPELLEPEPRPPDTLPHEEA
jgi:hypothetical protein